MSNAQMAPLRPETVTSILQSAVLAPSSHNTQPWHFEVDDQTISLYADRTRALPANDPEDRELTISCGCALMNLRVAAAHGNWAANYELLPNSEDEDLLAVVQLYSTEPSNSSEAELFSAIAHRRTYRKRFAPREVSRSIIEELVQAAAKEQAWLQVIDSEETRQAVAALVAEGDAIQWSNPSWRRELAAWMHPRRRGDGLTVPGLVLPVAQAVVRTFDMGNGVGANDRQLADESPVLAVLGTDGDGVQDWLAAGQALERVLLRAHRNGLQASHLNQPIQLASLRIKLQHLLGRSGFPQLLLRFGFAEEEIPAAPRRRLEDVVG
ncbi:Acg family FMN-binding oxidoreductase [Vacuolonema iberomarrocanum]|uniref:Acg family FMN-binding oxidoreductase n=1 Tax=Vacuolonema iberomarrocanum TaxID=3454632 RepID=UPI003F6E12C3